MILTTKKRLAAPFAPSLSERRVVQRRRMTLRAGAKTIRSLDGGFTAWARAGADVLATRLALGAGPVWL